MARSSKKPVFTSPGWHQALKARFLNFGFRHNPDALRLLATEVRESKITPQQWANQYHLGGTWVEEWVGDVLIAWGNQPYLVSEVDQLGNTDLPPTVYYPAPRDESTADDVFSFSVNGIPNSKLSLGITAGGSVPEGEPDDDWLQFKKQMHGNLDRALDWYQQNALDLGSSREVLIPNDLFRKTEVTAVYFFCAKNPAQILPILLERVGDRTTVHRWIQEITKLLDIPMKKRLG
jgi:hypothetical protein